MLMPLLAFCLVQPPPSVTPAPPLDWATLEAPLLRKHRQLTTRERFVKAGENYFSPDGKWIVFQAVEVPAKGKEPEPFYSMYVARLRGGELVDVTKVSPAGSANTCGWFHPNFPETPEVIFGSTIVAPKDEAPSGYQRGTSRYRWAFPSEMEVVRVNLAAGAGGGVNAFEAKPVFTRPNYDAECSYDSSGRFVLYAHIESVAAKGDAEKGGPEKSIPEKVEAAPPKPDANIYVFDTVTKKDIPLVVAPGYDGGPFFSPDGKWICYRSDRRGNDELQLFVAKLAFTREADGTMVPSGIESEFMITDNVHVNWCPYFHPSGKFLVYGTSEVGHQNYEVFAIDLDFEKFEAASKAPSFSGSAVVTDLRRRRVTQADGADVLPVFSPDGKWMLWCSQRGPKAEGEPRASSQIWIAEWVESAD